MNKETVFATAWFWRSTPSSGPAGQQGELQSAVDKEQVARQSVLDKEAQQDMSRPFEPPQLTPQFCFNQRVLRDFLRLSRASIDDSITQNLNALVTPGNRRFDANTTSARQHPIPPPRRLIDPSQSQDFKDRVLFPSWQMRSDVINYCASVATSPDPDDPDILEREHESAMARERVIDERLDPYSARYFPGEARTEALASLLRNERMVESIIRSRTWSIVEERCGSTAQTWEQALNTWRAAQSDAHK